MSLWIPICRRIVENPGSVGGRTDSGANEHSSLLMASPVPRLLIRARDLTVGDKKLGGGAFGIVYQGQWKGLDVAVKITNMEKLREAAPLTGEELTDSELMASAMEDVLSEAQEMQHLRHPNIVQFLGVCTDGKHGLMIVSELCKGGSLDKYLAKNRRLPLDVRNRFVREICEGVQYLHDHGILHRDLKPGNILLAEYLVIKISDFGMTRNVQVTSSSAADGIKGTSNYMSSEALDPDNCGPPFEGQSAVNIMMAVVVRKQVPRIPDSLPEHIKGAIKSCFAFNPKDRPTAKEVLAMLDSPSEAVLAPSLPVSPVDVPPAGVSSGIHVSMASTVPGPSSSVSPAQIKLAVAEEQTVTPTPAPTKQQNTSQARKRRSMVRLKGGAQYEGEWVGNTFDGYGILEKADEGKYEGQFKTNRYHGHGKCIKINGDVYEGEWKDNRRHGKGKLTHADGSRYEGDWADDKQTGYGVETWADGSAYKGYYTCVYTTNNNRPFGHRSAFSDCKDGMKHGEGVFTWPDGSTYEGHFVHNNLQGSGTYKWAEGRFYRGQWEGNKMHGEGLMEWPDGRHYEGPYHGDKKHGWGKFVWPDGRCYEGEWKDGKQHGKGTYTTASGISRRGEWADGIRVKWLTEAEAPAREQPSPQVKHTIFDAVVAGDVEWARLLVEEMGSEILDIRNGKGWTPFIRATMLGHADMMSLMHESKPDVLQQITEDGYTALHFAAANGHVAAVNKLLAWDPKLIDARDKSGGIHDGCRGLEWGGGALLNIENNRGKTPWGLANDKPEIREIMRPYKPACGPCCMIM
ncbi:unnamed protein product [Vitrella brassicaformis CCMP3155]|uniref:Protein kinase domain-containing protein n=2 Tax=Vitrella brassicaformis TaxID=1169539 RepID=A0A0G4F5G7_VITBC|nr:unnamed protein product [Vitrella brassicaformis CCMP3155]|eukprot:CEM06989.1 unnamed protein product [Vitrella brassicaformis CCMP3155]